MYSSGIMGWGPGNKASYLPWGNNGTANEFGPEEVYNYGDGYYLAATYYYTLPASYKGTTVTAGMTCGRKPTTANSPVTLTVPEPVGDILYLNVNGAAKQVTRVLLNVNGTAKEALVKANP